MVCVLNVSVNVTVVVFGKNFWMSKAMPLFATWIPSM